MCVNPNLWLMCVAAPLVLGCAGPAPTPPPDPTAGWMQRQTFFLVWGEAISLCATGRARVQSARARPTAQAFARLALAGSLHRTCERLQPEPPIQAGSVGAAVSSSARIVDETLDDDRNVMALACIDTKALRSLSPWNGRPALVDALESLARAESRR